MKYLRFLALTRFRPVEIPATPHLDAESKAAIDGLLTQSGVVMLEYGAGASSLYCARKGATVLSVESSRSWANILNQKLAAEGFAGSHVDFVDIGLTLKWGVPLDERPTEANRRKWQAYPAAPWGMADARGLTPRLILIDGRFRVASAAFCIREIARRRLDATLLFDDYLRRPEYHEIERVAQIVSTHGRMAEMKARTDIDAGLADQIIERYATHHR